MSLLKTISYILGNELDRTLLSLLDDDLDTFLDEKNYIKLVETLAGRNSRYTKQDGVTSLLRSTQKQNAWPGALRYLTVMHKLIHDFGNESYTWISSEKMQHFNNFKTQESNLKLFVHKAMVTYYFSYLQKLSYSYEDLSICFHLDRQFINKLVEDNISPLHFLSKVQNILQYLIQIFSLLEVSLTKFSPCALVKQVAYFCFTDCYRYYNYLNKIISPLLKQIFKFPPQEAILLFELYSDHLIITRKLDSISPLARELPDFPLKIPEFYKLDPDYNKMMELHVASLRSQKNRNSNQETKLRSKNHHPQISIKACEDNYYSPKELLQVISGVIVATNTILSPKRRVFDPPFAQNKKKPNNMRAVHPGEFNKNLSTLTVPMDLQDRFKESDKNEDRQRTRGSIASNARIDASIQLDKSIGEGGISSHTNSTYPLAMNESFLGGDNVGNSSFIHGVC